MEQPLLVHALVENEGLVIIDCSEEQELISCEVETPEWMAVYQRIVHNNFVFFLATAFVSAEQGRERSRGQAARTSTISRPVGPYEQ